jgi:hypothetical protein
MRNDHIHQATMNDFDSTLTAIPVQLVNTGLDSSSTGGTPSLFASY